MEERQELRGEVRVPAECECCGGGERRHIQNSVAMPR